MYTLYPRKAVYNTMRKIAITRQVLYESCLILKTIIVPWTHTIYFNFIWHHNHYNHPFNSELGSLDIIDKIGWQPKRLISIIIYMDNYNIIYLPIFYLYHHVHGTFCFIPPIPLPGFLIPLLSLSSLYALFFPFIAFLKLSLCAFKFIVIGKI